MVFLAGGPPHQDMFDLKMDAPAEIRGEFRPIATNVPGLEICEHLPRLAAMMDKWSVIRSIVGADGEHAACQCLTGYPTTISKRQGGRPSLGAILSKLQGPVDPSVPPFVGLSPRMGHQPWADPGDPGLPRPGPRPVRPQPGRDARPGRARPQARPDRLGDRKALLGELDDLRREVDATRRHRRDGRLHRPRLRHPDLEQAGRGARRHEGRPAAAGQVRRTAT